MLPIMQTTLRATFASFLIAGLATAVAGPAAAAAPLDEAAATAAIQQIGAAAFVAARADRLSTSCDGRDLVRRGGYAALHGVVADARHAAIYAEMAKHWDAGRRVAFARLLDAQEVFARVVGDEETDHMPANAALESVRAEQMEKGAFLVLLRSVVDGTTRLQFVDYAETDSALNATYVQVMASSDTTGLAWGTVEKAGIRCTQRAWLAYRDAFIAFAATFDAGVAESVRAELTTRRTMSLEGFLAD